MSANKVPIEDALPMQIMWKDKWSVSSQFDTI